MDYLIYLSYTNSDDDNTAHLITKWLIPELTRRMRLLLGSADAGVLGSPDVKFNDHERYEFLDARLALEAIHVSLVTPTLFRNREWALDLEWFANVREPSVSFKSIVGAEFVPTPELRTRMGVHDGHGDQPGRDPASILLQRRTVKFDADVLELTEEDAWQESEGLNALVRIVLERVVEARRWSDQFAVPQTIRSADGRSSREANEEVPLEPVQPYRPDLPRSEHGPSVLAQRIEEFEKEKAFLGKYFTDFLHSRLAHLRSDRGGCHVLLLVDAGTTLFPVIRELGTIAKNSESLDHVCLATNNLPGVRWLLQHGRPSGNKWKEISLKTVLLPGVPLPAYSAATGWEQGANFHPFEGVLDHLQTHRVVEEIGRLRRDGWRGRIIAVVTGNWVRVRRHFPSVAVPMARGRGHMMFKQALCEAADEVYVVAPLGKVIAGAPGVANILREASTPHPTQQEYKEVQTELDGGGGLYDDIRGEPQPEDIAGKMHLVTTYRLPDRLLSGLSNQLLQPGHLLTKQVHKLNYEDVKRAFAERAHRYNWMFLFDDLNRELSDQRDQEFPHEESRIRSFYRLMNVGQDLEEQLLALRPAQSSLP